MEHEKGLDLSLALPCGGSIYSLKEKNDSSSCVRLDEDDRGSKLINEFKNFLEGGKNQLHLKPEQNTDFGKFVVGSEISINLNMGETWMSSDCRARFVEQENKSSVDEGKEGLFSETSFQKKRESETNNLEWTDKNRAPHVSRNVNGGSTAENEDVADSDADGSISRHISQKDDVSICYVASGGMSKVQKEIHENNGPNDIDHFGKKRLKVLSEKELIIESLFIPHRTSLPTQPGNVANMPSQLVNDSSPTGIPSLAGYSLPVIMHFLGAANNEQDGIQPVMCANFPLTFGYTSPQFIVVDKDSTQSIHSHLQNSSYMGRNHINLDMQNDRRELNQAVTDKSFGYAQCGGRAVEHGKSEGKQFGELDFSSPTGDNQNAGNTIHQLNDASNQLRPDSLLSRFPAIRPGIAADLKFRGCGNHPNLPWVSTTGLGPSGRTISGVTYKYNATQIKIVCACHGSHMSPEGFIQHASEDNGNPYSGTGLTPPNSNPAASAQS